jgi:glycosyltransferase involved in cell wall biosynthesis
VAAIVADFDIVHIHGLQSYVGTMAMAAARKAGVSYVVEPHGALDRYHWQQGRLRKRLYRHLLDRKNWRNLSGAVYSSDREAFAGQRVLGGVKSYMMPLGVDDGLFALPRHPKSEPTVAYVGRITRKKRLDLVLAAMNESALTNRGVRLIVAGSSDGTLKVDPVEYVAGHGLEERVDFVGPVDARERARILSQSSAFVLPSEDESYGMAVAEAMAAGLPVVTSAEVGIAPAAASGNAVRVAELTPASLAHELLVSIDDPGLGARARKYAAEQFTWSRAGKMAAEMYSDVIAAKHTARRRMVIITQPYVPAYRVPLFEAVRAMLAEHNVDMLVAAGNPAGDQAGRGDSSRPAWVVPVKQRALRLGGRVLAWRRVESDARPDLVVSELEALNLFAWVAGVRRSSVVLWGHGKPYVNDVPRIAELIEWVLARRATHVMTYTTDGRDYLVREGRVSPESVTAIGNSTDTTSLRRSFYDATPEKIRDMRDIVGEGTRALFVGGLDSSKRIDFLLAAAREARREDPSFKLVVVGMGALEAEVAEAVSQGFAIHIPSARGEALALLGHACSAVWMPGRVGLVAVDALALGLPVHTTRFAHHAPEIDFLEEGEVAYLPDDPGEFAARSLVLLTEYSGGARVLRDDIPSIESVAARFADVILSVLGKGSRRNA